jgi:hypothetical protein
MKLLEFIKLVPFYKGFKQFKAKYGPRFDIDSYVKKLSKNCNVDVITLNYLMDSVINSEDVFNLITEKIKLIKLEDEEINFSEDEIIQDFMQEIVYSELTKYIGKNRVNREVFHAVLYATLDVLNGENINAACKNRCICHHTNDMEFMVAKDIEKDVENLVNIITIKYNYEIKIE